MEQSTEKIIEVFIIGIKNPKYPTKAIDIPAIAEMHAIQYVQATINPGK